jgi:hypothetical protein
VAGAVRRGGKREYHLGIQPMTLTQQLVEFYSAFPVFTGWTMFGVVLVLIGLAFRLGNWK